MLNINNIIKTTATLALSAFAFASCMEIEDPQSGAVGYLALPSLDVDVTMDDLSLTKAASAPSVNAPSADELKNVRYVVKEKGTSTDLLDGKPWTEALTLPVDKTYVIEAYYGENSFDAAYFYGSKEVTIEALETIIPVCTLKVSNSLLCISTDPVKEHFTFSEAVLTSGDMSKHITSVDTWTFVPADSELTVVIKGTAASTGKAMTPVTHKLTPEASKAYNLICGKDEDNWPTITFSLNTEEAWASRIYITTPAQFSENISLENQAAVVYEAIPSSSEDWTDAPSAVVENDVLVIKGLTPGKEYQVRARVGSLVSNIVNVTPALDGFTAEAVHTLTNEELDGTDVTSVFSKPAVIKNSIGNWTINLCKSDGTVLRSGLSLGTSDGSSITATDGWPYLPVGSYKLVANVTMKDGEVIIAETSFSTASPSFKVVPTCKTTYDYYLAGDKANANAESGSTTSDASAPNHSLFEIGSSVGISSNLMKNTNYSKTVYYAAKKDNTVVIDKTVDFGTSKSNTVGDVHDLFTDWRAYTLSVTVTFAGSPVTATDDFHITGLPYSVSFSGLTSSPAGWSTSGSVSWSGYGWNAGDGAEYLRLRGANSYSDRGKILSPAFSIPDNSEIDVTSIVDCYYYASSGQKQTIYVNSNTASCSEITSNATDIKNGTTFNNFNAIGDVTNTMILSNSKPHISITHNVPKEGAATRFMGIKSCVIKYM